MRSTCFVRSGQREDESFIFIGYHGTSISSPMKKAVLMTAVATLYALTTAIPVQADEAAKKTAKSFEEKKEQKLERANMKLSKAHERVKCIKVAENIKALKKCK